MPGDSRRCGQRRREANIPFQPTSRLFHYQHPHSLSACRAAEGENPPPVLLPGVLAKKPNLQPVSTASLEETSDLGTKRLRIEGLLELDSPSFLQQLPCLVAQRVARYQNHLDPWVVLPYCLVEIHPADIGHHHVADDQGD